MSPLFTAPSEACSPDCGGPYFNDDLAACAQGKLGDLTRHGARCRALGFLLMHGLSAADRKLIADSLPMGGAPPRPDITAWLKARNKVPGLAPDIRPEALFGDTWYANCLTGAFEVAAKTLEERIAKSGAKSPEVMDWTKAQDRVFANCGGGKPVLPEPAPAGVSALARADRAYQTAAAQFYSWDFQGAIERLDTISKDAASPWRVWAPLVAVRAVIRQATLRTADEGAARALLEKARERCVAITKDAALKDIHRPTRQLTWFIDYRLRPEKQLNLLGRVLLAKPDANFGYAWRDYFSLRAAQLPATDELSAFLDVFEKKYSYPQALAWWKKTRSLPWLVAALSLASGKEPELAELLAQSASVPEGSPAFVSVHAARGRVAFANGRLDDARAELLGLLAPGAASLPALTAQPLAESLRKAALTLEEWAQYAHLAPADAGNFFDQGVPLSRFKDAKLLGALDPKLRREVVLAGWARAVLLERWEEEKALEPRVAEVAPELATDLANVGARKEPAERKMAAVLLLLKSPGISPLVRPYRTQEARKYEYCGPNGWCGGGEVTDLYEDCHASQDACGMRFISPEERREVLPERQQLANLGKSPELLIRFTLDYAKVHPTDALVPEALHESVRQTHFARNYCGPQEGEDKARSRLSKQAFQLLQRKYAKTEWAQKTPIHY